MPQLNPDPWLIILIFTWAVFLIILPNKIISHSIPNEPSAKDPSNLLTEIWSWPWH
uniref:ATP synthase complex subunit 8 n=1 Tax=Polypterus mokelembembe TaxID=764552 RepID=F2W4M3_9ACTI|nr:ATP synthase F0 subunit 8 [Polypterus mokelembembe]ADG95261.1 ATP synthase F0 subunit 8 [Polypterus mokelembembe]